MLSSIFFIDENNGFTVSEYEGAGSIYKTTNGGTNWIQCYPPSYAATFRACHFENITTGWVAGDFGKILKTTDGGINWFYQMDNKGQLNTVFFENSDVGWAAGDGKILKTTNGGSGWSICAEGLPELNSIFFNDLNNGWVVGGGSWPNSDGVVLMTTNGGTDWVEQYTDTQYYFKDCKILDNNHGWVVGTNNQNKGKILKTTNGGNDWIIQLEEYSVGFNSVDFINQNIGWVVAGEGKILKTTNGGLNWNEQTSNTDIGLNSVLFVDDNTGWIAGGDPWGADIGIILTTTNGGEEWITQITDTIGSISAVYFTNSNYGWATRENGNYFGLTKILHTTNGGITWTAQYNSYYSFNSVYFTDVNTGWVAGGGFYPDWGGFQCIFKTTNGGVSFVEEEQIDEIPTEFLLSQNYPNPFNPSTKIKYAIPNVDSRQPQTLQTVTLKVYDILGNEIETLVNEEKPAGTYEITWYAANLPSGVYFYQLQSG